MYPNLNAELARRDITATKLSKLTKIPYSTLMPKIRGDKAFKLGEAFLIKKVINCDLPLDILFEERDVKEVI